MSAVGATLRQPSAWLPLAMSAAAVCVLVAAFASHGVVREPDEGTAAHLWQLLMGGQLPIVAFFAVTWLPRATLAAIVVLELQFVAGLVAAAPVFIFQL